MSSSTQDLTQQVDLGSTFGALFIGVVLSAVLFGATNVQAFVYFQTHRDTGRTFYKFVVIWLWILDALHLALIIHCVYYYLVINYADINALTEIVWSFKFQIIIDFLIVYGVHFLYLYRIWIVGQGRSRPLLITVGIFVILGSGVGITLMWAMYQCHVFTDLLKIEWSTYMTVGTTTFLDIIIASSLSYLLATSRTGFSGTDSLITKLMGYTINTGCLTSMCSMTVMITCAVMPQNFIFLSIFFLLVKLYVNSFLALLNAPHYMQPNTSPNDLSTFCTRDGVTYPEVHLSQNRELQASRHTHPDAVTHPTPSVVPQRPIEVMVEMDYFSSE